MGADPGQADQGVEARCRSAPRAARASRNRGRPGRRPARPAPARPAPAPHRCRRRSGPSRPPTPPARRAREAAPARRSIPASSTSWWVTKRTTPGAIVPASTPSPAQVLEQLSGDGRLEDDDVGHAPRAGRGRRPASARPRPRPAGAPGRGPRPAARPCCRSATRPAAASTPACRMAPAQALALDARRPRSPRPVRPAASRPVRTGPWTGSDMTVVASPPIAAAGTPVATSALKSRAPSMWTGRPSAAAAPPAGRPATRRPARRPCGCSRRRPATPSAGGSRPPARAHGHPRRSTVPSASSTGWNCTPALRAAAPSS